MATSYPRPGLRVSFAVALISQKSRSERAHSYLLRRTRKKTSKKPLTEKKESSQATIFNWQFCFCHFIAQQGKLIRELELKVVVVVAGGWNELFSVLLFQKRNNDMASSATLLISLWNRVAFKARSSDSCQLPNRFVIRNVSFVFAVFFSFSRNFPILLNGSDESECKQFAIRRMLLAGHYGWKKKLVFSNFQFCSYEKQLNLLNSPKRIFRSHYHDLYKYLIININLVCFLSSLTLFSFKYIFKVQYKFIET